MPADDIWTRVDEAIDTDPLQLRDIVAEVLSRAEQAEDRLRAATDAYARLKAQADDAEAARDRWRKRGQQAEAERDAAHAAIAEARKICEHAHRKDKNQLAGAVLDELPPPALDAPSGAESHQPVGHLGGRANAEDCPACSGTNPRYPFICPGNGTESHADGRTGLNATREPHETPQGPQKPSQPRANGNGS